MKMSPKVKKTIDTASTVLVVLAVLFALFLVGARLFGLEVRHVTSGSMEPVYSKHDLLYIKKVHPETIEAGDVITFVMNENLTVGTHRVVRVDKENRHFYTKGDANEGEDITPVLFDNVIGTPVFALPYLGWVAAQIQKPPGMYIAIGLGVALLAVVFLPDLFKKKKAKEEILTQDTTTQEETGNE